MKGYERNYDFADLIDCASGLNRLASMEYGEEKLRMSTSHAKQHTIWGKLHPLVVGDKEPDLSDFARVTNQTWWKTLWIVEKSLGVFDKASEVAADHLVAEAEEFEGDIANLEAPGDLWALTSHVQPEGEESEQEDGVNDLAVVGHETRHVMSEILQDASDEEVVKKFDPMVVYDGHAIYKATLVSQLVGNPTLSKDRLTRIKQSIYFNGVKQKPRVDGVPVCILDIGSDCAVLFNSETTGRNTRSNRRRPANPLSKDVWIGRAQKIRRKYNGKWGKTRTEVDLLDRPVATTGEGCICQVLFNWYSPLRNSREKFKYDCTDLQWIDIESVITVVSMKVEHNVHTVWCLDANDRAMIDEFMQSL
ncbi:hypothetical protein R1sor_001999 [Riccia sorocarpa]|uniref:Transposase n=1 Tax=Riccia sorocarpa TaxID=122646 RepID=A0ABD3H0N2_9MARC